MTRPSTLAPGAVLTGVRRGWSERAGARSLDGAVGRRSASLRSVAIMALGATLAAAPFEGVIGSFGLAGLVVTGLEVVWSAALIAWVAVLVRERRVPAVPRLVWVALTALAVVTFASALLAGPLSDGAVRFAFRSAAFWATFLATADLCRTEGAALRVLVAALVGATLAAAIAWLAYARGTSVGLIGLGRDFTVAGQLRVTGPFDYPNTAAMAWEAVLLVSLPLVLLPGRWWRRGLLVVALIIVCGALILTFSRGAVVGALCGLAAMAGLAILTRRLRPALLATATGVALVAGMLVAQLGTGIPIARLTVEGDRDLYGAAYSAPASVELGAGSRARVPVTVTNAGAAPWHAGGDEAFALSYHWLDPATGRIITLDGARTPLPRTLGPGERIAVDALVVAPDEPGRHVLAWDIVHERVAWLSEKGVPAWATTVDVGSPTGSTGPPLLSGAVQVWPDLVPVPSRGELWAAAFEMIRQHPVLGVGAGMFRVVYGEYLGWVRWDERIHANDLYLELAATTGLIGLACFLVLVLVVMARGLRTLLRREAATGGLVGPPEPASGDGWLLRVGLVAALVAFLAHGVVDYFLAFAPTGLLFWAILGLALGLSRNGRATVREPVVAT